MLIRLLGCTRTLLPTVGRRAMSASAGKLSLEQIRRLPKTELHTHLDGCLRPSTLIDLAQKDGILLPNAPAPGVTPSEKELQAILLPPNGTSSLVEFLQAFGYTLPVLQNTAALQRVLREMAEDYGADGISYLEIRFCPDLHTDKGCSNEEILRAACEESRRVTREALAQMENGLKEGEAALPVTRILVCGLRNMEPLYATKLAQLTVRLAKEEADTLPVADRQIAGFDLAGDEAGFQMQLFKEAFDHIHTNSDLGITIHAGEAAGWDSVRQAVDVGHATRIGHGVRLHESAELLERLALSAQTTTIEVCMTSNLLTKACDKLEEHPVRRFFEEGQGKGRSGLKISPCTDGNTMIGKSVSDQYHILQETFGFTPKELVSLVDNGYEAAFIPQEVRAPLLERARKQCQAVLSSAGISD